MVTKNAMVKIGRSYTSSLTATSTQGSELIMWRFSVKVGDLVKEFGDAGRTGIIVAEIPHKKSFHSRLFKVLWNERSQALPTLVGPKWESRMELVSESR